MLLRLLPLLFYLTVCTGCTAQQDQSPVAKNSPYTFDTPSRDGTGKYYMGREISHVMGHPAADGRQLFQGIEQWLHRYHNRDHQKIDRTKLIQRYHNAA